MTAHTHPVPTPSSSSIIEAKTTVLAVVKKLLSAISIPGNLGRETFISTLAPRGLATHARGKEVEYEDFPSFADRIPWDSGMELVEGLDGEPTVHVDRDVAVVWAPYWFTVDGELTGVGTDVLTLMYRDWTGQGEQEWLIVNVADNSRPPTDEDRRRVRAREGV